MDNVLESLEIIVGTYEEFLLGYKVIQLENEEPSLIQSFANHSHRASVRSVASGGKFLASGGTDESILLYDMVARKEAGLLMHHNGNINCVEFSSNGSHLLSGSEDGSIGVCRAGSWQLEKLWGSAHKGSPVTSISVHPSGKLFLSVGPDGKIRTWNLVKGRLAYASILCKPKEGRLVTQVLWSPDGETYAVVIGTRVEIFTVTAANVVHTIQLQKKVTCICFLDACLLCVATEEGDATVHNIVGKKQVAQFVAHEGRVRCMASYRDHWVITASSAGQIKLWRRKDEGRMREICATNTGCRITCLSAITSAPLDELTKQDVKIDMSDIATFQAGSSMKRKRQLGIVTVEDSTTEAPIKKTKKKLKRAPEICVNDVAREGITETVELSKKEKRNKRKIVTDTDLVDVAIEGVAESKKKRKKERKVIEISLDNNASVCGTETLQLSKMMRNKRKIVTDTGLVDVASEVVTESIKKKANVLGADNDVGEQVTEAFEELSKKKKKKKNKGNTKNSSLLTEETETIEIDRENVEKSGPSKTKTRKKHSNLSHEETTHIQEVENIESSMTTDVTNKSSCILKFKKKDKLKKNYKIDTS